MCIYNNILALRKSRIRVARPPCIFTRDTVLASDTTHPGDPTSGFFKLRRTPVTENSNRRRGHCTHRSRTARARIHAPHRQRVPRGLLAEEISIAHR
eukprot:6144927-Prymnesium_polylepis.1